MPLTELDEGVRPGGRVDFVAVLGVELLRQVLQESVGGLLAKLPVAERQEARVLLDDVARRK